MHRKLDFRAKHRVLSSLADVTAQLVPFACAPPNCSIPVFFNFNPSQEHHLGAPLPDVKGNIVNMVGSSVTPARVQPLLLSDAVALYPILDCGEFDPTHHASDSFLRQNVSII